jgi:hypothetical protein
MEKEVLEMNLFVIKMTKRKGSGIIKYLDFILQNQEGDSVIC